LGEFDLKAESEQVRDTDEDWKRIAEQNPYWGVLSAEKFKGRELGEAELKEFYHSGQVFVQNLLGFIRAHIFPGFNPTRSLDFGCGVGRLLGPLARISRQAVGVDVAPPMLEIAERNLRAMGIDNVQYVLSDDSLSRVEGDFDLVNSYIVLQHIPPARGYRIVQALLGKVRKGGCASIQLTYGKDRRFFSHEAGKARAYRREGNMIIDLLPQEDRADVGAINMFDYDLNQILAMAGPLAGHPMLLLPTFDDHHLGVHIIMARA
jgi:2-polyprenyl-3-methyl-5-hydroxy-6-metoxy-1,4-benzoquinol methylase